MRLIDFKCKIYSSEDTVIGDDDYEIKTLFIDVDKINAFHIGDEETTIIYCDGTVYEILIPIDQFTRLRLSQNLTPPAKDRFVLMFSNN